MIPLLVFLRWVLAYFSLDSKLDLRLRWKYVKLYQIRSTQSLLNWSLKLAHMLALATYLKFKRCSIYVQNIRKMKKKQFIKLRP